MAIGFTNAKSLTDTFLQRLDMGNFNANSLFPWWLLT